MHTELLNPWQEPTKVKLVWEELTSQTKVSYFLTWGWIGNWLNSLSQTGIDLKLLVCYADGTPQCVFFLGNRVTTRRKIIRSKSLFLNTTGFTGYDDLWIEYNSMPCKRSVVRSLETIVSSIPHHWDEIVLPGLDAETLPGDSICESILPYRMIIDRDEPAPYVDLDQVRKAPGGYFSLLGKKSRSHIRQSYRAYEKQGSVELTQATDLDIALEIYDELVKYHQKTWVSRGFPGAFASKYFYDFHKQLVISRFRSGEIQLLKITCGTETIGCLYNFVHNGIVHHYQSGINYGLDKQLQPGLVSLTAAIVHNAGLDHAVFDFMAGGSTYKRRLSTHEKRVIWARIQKPRFKFEIEKKLDQVYTALRNRNGGGNTASTS